MNEYLVGIMYHDPESYDLWNKGIIEDYESSTAVFIKAYSEHEAIQWGKIIADKLFKLNNPNELNNWSSFSYDCWIEDIKKTDWRDSLDFFQYVELGEMPNLKKMGSGAYEDWFKNKH